MPYTKPMSHAERVAFHYNAKRRKARQSAGG